jgi:hypothetical protein
MRTLTRRDCCTWARPWGSPFSRGASSSSRRAAPSGEPLWAGPQS